LHLDSVADRLSYCAELIGVREVGRAHDANGGVMHRPTELNLEPWFRHPQVRDGGSRTLENPVGAEVVRPQDT
jgi:hypothetical protein